MHKPVNYKIVFSDIDGTLLNKNRELSNLTIQQIKRVVENHNVKFVMVSARMPLGMQHLYNQLSIDSPIICYNGALILSSLTNGFKSQNILHSQSINHDIVQKLFKEAKSKDIHFGLFSNNNWYANKIDEWTLKEENNTRVKSAIQPDMDELIAGLIDQKLPIHKLMIMGDVSKIDTFINFSNQNYGSQVTNYRSKDTYIEVSPITSNKASGCAFLLNHLNISSNDAIAFGDNHNDVEMIKNVGLGIAMENAPSEVKNVAKRVAPSNLSDGVALTIRTIFE